MGCKNSKLIKPNTDFGSRTFSQAPIFIVPKDSRAELAAVFVKQTDLVRIEVTAVFVDPNAPKVSKKNHKVFKFVNYKRPVAIRTLTFNVKPVRIDNVSERTVVLRNVSTLNCSGSFGWEHEMNDKDGIFGIFEADTLEMRGNRPLIHINCKNMSWHGKDNNEGMDKRVYEHYPIYHGKSSQVKKWFDIQDPDAQ